jgi:hypothetical protein
MTAARMTAVGWSAILLAVVLAVVVTPALALVALIGLALLWAAPNQAGTVMSYTYHGSGHDDLGGRGANDSRRGL